MVRRSQEEAEAAAPHVLIIPYPSHGHILPLLDLASLLSRRRHVITIAVTPKNLPFLSPLLASSPTIRPLVLPFPSYPPLPPNVENAKDLPPSSSPGRNLSLLIHALSYLYAPLLDWSRSVANPPDVIIVDFFVGWANKLADQLSVPCITFCPYGPFALSLVHCLWRDMPRRDSTDVESNFPIISFPSVPGSPVFPWCQLSSIYRSYEEGDPVSEFVRVCFLENFRSWGFIFDSFYEFEGDYLDHVRRVLGHARVWAVGPLNRAGRCPAGERGGPASVPAGDVLKWLDGFEAGSVVYVSFGSQVVLTAAQGAALAAGLERSGVRFVWCVKEATAVQKGFDERVRGRGMVIRGWAPQVALLSHESVGSFLTHCGWNSVLEGLSAGLTLLTWPMVADQYMNARLVVEEAKVGVRVCEGADAVPDPDELARILGEAASRAGNGEVKMRARVLRREALDAVREGGSSNQDLNVMVEEINKLKLKAHMIGGASMQLV